jgi:murein DD-endopeptidase MepM/ murein hydrolase activator NlpD
MPSAASHRPDNFIVRLIPARQILVQSASGYRSYTFSTRGQLLALLLVYLGAAGLTFGVTGRLGEGPRPTEQAPFVASLERPSEAADRPRVGSETVLRQIIADLERLGAEQRDTIESLTGLREAAELDLAAAREEAEALAGERDAARAALAEERDATRQALAALAVVRASAGGGGAAGPTPAVVATADGLARGLHAKLATVEAQLAAATSERDRLKRAEKGLRWRVELLETRLGEMRQAASAEAGRVRQWIVRQVSALEAVLATAGVDVDRLIRRVDTRLSTGQGGPFEPVALRGGSPGGGGRPGARQPALRAEMSRLRAVHALLAAMPLVPPMSTFRTTSGFGERRDPITGRRAMHAGLDFGGPDGASVLVTAPGRVVAAARSGAYGIMVEVDHGMGITTRYAHLERALVRPGDQVTLRQPVGIMGSTGRSTGEHLHYEVRIDGVAHDPSQFLEAGRALRDVFKG